MTGMRAVGTGFVPDHFTFTLSDGSVHSIDRIEDPAASGHRSLGVAGGTSFSAAFATGARHTAEFTDRVSGFREVASPKGFHQLNDRPEVPVAWIEFFERAH